MEDMNFNTFKKLAKSISIGKNLPDAIYLHKSAINHLPPSLLRFIQNQLAELGLQNEEWDLIKIFKAKYRVSLLCYPEFFSASYPALHASFLLDFESNTQKKRSYKNSKNPPILHRKETFLAPDHPKFEIFRGITRKAEDAGLFASPKNIGTQKGWEVVTKEKGYRLVDGHLEKIDSSAIISQNEVARHKTAIDRYSLSSPMQSLYRHGYLSGQHTVLDYGCGKGDDIRILAQHDVQANGWDPVYLPDSHLTPCDVVNLGFVINVIEDQQERKATLKKAYKYAQKILVVAVMLGGESITSQFKQYGDGVITARNTFQKYYSQQELRNYLESTLSETAIAVGPGIFYIFRDKIEEQNFLVEREKGKRNWSKLSYIHDPQRLEVKQRAFYELNKDLLDNFWERCLELGRQPADVSEFKESETIRALCGSHNKAFQLLVHLHKEDVFTNAAKIRQEDLLVYLALGLFKQRKVYSKMPVGLQRDIKYFWGKYTNAIQEARDILFSVGRADTIIQACQSFYQKINVGLLEDKSFTFHKSYLAELPAILRIYVGCATQLYGDLEDVDLIKIHNYSGKVSLMRYENFMNSPLPLLKERIKIKMTEQEIDFFTYGDQFPPHPLYLKSQFLNPEMKNYSNQVRFDTRLRSFEWLDLSNYGPKREEFDHLLAEKNGLQVKGFRFYKKHSM